MSLLLDHAKDHVWCNPQMDKHHVILPARLTPDNGAINDAYVYWERIPLPETDRFHVYQIGHHPDVYTGIASDLDHWQSLNTLINDNAVLIDVYTRNGIMLPKIHCYLMRLENKNLLLAVKFIDYIDITDELLYLRFYDNAYFHSLRSMGQDTQLQCGGVDVTTPQSTLPLLNTFYTLQTLPGHVSLYLNGRYIHTCDPNHPNNGDILEYIYDPSIYAVKDFPIKDLPYFDANDGQNKYLVITDMGTSTILFYDDIDICLYKPVLNELIDGVYYHRHLSDAVSMVTNEDYALPTLRIAQYAQHAFDDTIQDMLVLRLHFRHSGYDRKLVFEHNRLHELMKLPTTLRLDAMLNKDSTVEAWRANHLETSNYNQLMKTPLASMTEDMVIDAYGYYALALLVYDTPQRPVGRRVDVPTLCQSASTAFEYDAHGVLLSWYIHRASSVYYTQSDDAHYVEFIPGIGDTHVSDYLNQTQIPVTQGAQYRVYLRPLDTMVWQDITDTDDVRIEDDTLYIDIDTSINDILVRDDTAFLCYHYDIDVSKTKHVITMPLITGEMGMGQSILVPYHVIDVYLNGHPLIRGLDFHLLDNTVYIVTKSHLIDGDLQDVTIRAWGLAQGIWDNQIPIVDWKPNEPYGWVKWGYLSVNQRYDIRDDQIIRCIVGGHLTDRSAIHFAEDRYHVMIQDIPNGTPYVIEYYKPTLDALGIDLQTEQLLKTHGHQVTQEIEDYLTYHYPEPTITTPIIIDELYNLYSPYISTIMDDLQTGRLKIPDGRVTDKELSIYVSDYTYLLKVDPATMDIDWGFAAVHPHLYNAPASISQRHYTLLDRLCQLYLNGRVDMTQFAIIDQ